MKRIALILLLNAFSAFSYCQTSQDFYQKGIDAESKKDFDNAFKNYNRSTITTIRL